MKASELKVGTVAWCNVSGTRREVVVVEDTGKRGRRYRIKVVATGKVLDTLRSGSALHASRYGEWRGCFGEDDDSRRSGILGYKGQ